MKKKIVSMILSFSLVISGLPLTVANAAELGENEPLQEEESKLDETDEVAGTNEAAGTDNNTNDETETADVNQTVTFDEKVNAVALAADYSNFNVNSEGKVVGSDGVTYDDIAYLSANTVAAFDTEAQEEYIDFCDTAAEWLADGIENIVIAVDEDGLLNFSYQIPGIMLAEAREDIIEEALSSETDESAEDEDTSKDSDDVDNTETTSSENTDTEENETKESETITDETTSDEESETESGAEEVTVNESEEIKADDSTEEIPADDLENSDSETENQAGDDLSVEEPETDDLTAEEPLEDVSGEIKAENMELIPVIENEQVELADELNLEVIDLGYDLGYGMDYTVYSTLPSESYFSKQLNSSALKVYNAARPRLTTGNTTFNLPSNVFNVRGNGKAAMNNAIMCALSALELTYPDKVDWMAPGGTTNVSSKYDLLSGKVVSGTVTIEKSSYYSVALDEKANAKVSSLVAAAQSYALSNYSMLPAYGVVEYFDKWICENNYYNTPGGVNKTQGNEVYYYCHSAYGALLKGYAVCESYAKAMSRLLDAVGIPNVYVTGVASNGTSSGGHAWNYVQMPDTNWYLLDSTWNNPSQSASDASKTSTKKYLLSAGDPYHIPDGRKYTAQKDGFKFPELSTSKYVAKKEAIKLSETNVNLVAKQKIKLSCDNKEINNIYSTWTSSDTSVAKVDKKGNVTAVAPGTAVITLSTLATAGIELSAQCTVKVYQVKNILSARTGKATDSLSIGTNESSKTLVFNVDVGAKSPYTAQQMVANALPISGAKKAAAFSNVKAKSSKEDIAGVTATLTGDKITAVITPYKAGSSNVTLEFGGKKATIKVNVGDLIDKSMFDIKWEKAGVDETTKSIEYTGKAVAPKVTKNAAADKAVKFKTTYLNNKDAGTASVIVSGTGKYGGEVKYDFTIKQLPIDSSHIEFKLNKASNVYNAAVNPAKTTVKYKNGTKKTGLKLNTDYQIVYKNGSTTITNPKSAGAYTLTVKGIGNYSGEYAVPDAKYTIDKCEINKAKVTLALSNKPLTPKVKASVMLGKNDLDKSEYTIKYYSDKDCTNEVSFLAIKAKTKYYALITAKGSNMTNNASKKFVKAFTAK